MTAINFPDTPSVNQVFTAAGRSWVWDGTVWNAVGTGINPDNQYLTAVSPIQYDETLQSISIDVSAINKPLEDITNVSITSVANGQALVFDSATSKWINATVDVQGAITAANQYTDTSISNLVDAAPAALNTLNELAAALGDDASFATSVTNQIATKSDKIIQFNEQTSNIYTLALSDADKLVELNSISSITLTVPTNASVAFPVGTTISVLQSGPGQVTVSPDSGVTINSTPSLLLRTQWSSASLVKRSTDTWLLSGDLE